MTASFLPKPVVGVNGSGMHTNVSISRNGTNLFLDPKGQESFRAAVGSSLASDTWADNVTSQHVHEALGFEVVDRCVHYRKRL